MKNILLSVLLLIYPILTNCQERTINVKNFEEGKIPNWVNWKFEYSDEIELKHVHDNNNQYHFRFSTDKQIIEIYMENEGETLKGQIVNWTLEYVDRKEESTNRIFYKKKKLDSIEIEKIVQLIQSSKIDEVPDDESIEKWQSGLDGITYSIEIADKNKYTYKSYWTPTVQNSVEEAERIQRFVDEIIMLTKAEKYWNEFRAQIPYECYINYGPEITCKILTRLEKRKYKKDRKNYRQHSGERSYGRNEENK